MGSSNDLARVVKMGRNATRRFRDLDEQPGTLTGDALAAQPGPEIDWGPADREAERRRDAE